MYSKWTFFLFALLFVHTAQAQYEVKGRVLDSDAQPLDYVLIALPDLEQSTYTDENGYFEIGDIPQVKTSLKISATGYRVQTFSLDFNKMATVDLGEVTLENTLYNMDELVVTGTLKARRLSTSPVKVEVLSSKLFEQTISPTNLVESMRLVPGVQEVVACGVCGTNSLSINGLPGPYTAVLLDGAPIYGNLAAVYGLNGIPNTIVDRIEIIKGPSSTLYGSEAVAGVINVITKDPETQPLLALDLMATTHNEVFTNLSLAPKIGKWKGLIGLQHAYVNDFEDFNNDNMGDGVAFDRLSLFTKWNMSTSSGLRRSIAAKYYFEDRRNGVKDFVDQRNYREIRGNDSLYGESIYTNRGELFGTFDWSSKISTNYSFSYHDQNSYYGSDFYEAQQGIAFTNTTWRNRFDAHELLTGLTLRYQYYDDNTIATGDTLNGLFQNKANQQFIPGIFVQDEWNVNDKLVLLTGARLDYYKAHGPIFAPRLNAKYKLSDWTTLRANFGTGFRIVNLFTEDHAFITGNRSVEIQEALDPEQSYNGTLNLNHIFAWGRSQGSIDIDAYYTYFTNAIFPDYDSEPNKIIYANSEGYAQTRGINIQFQQSFEFPLSYSLGWNMQKVTKTDINAQQQKETSNIEFAADWSGVFTVQYQFQKIGLGVSYVGQLVGPKQLPEVFDLNANGTVKDTPRATRSEPYYIQQIQCIKTFKNKPIELYAGIMNALNYRQPVSPLVGYNDPNAPTGFSSYFDTAYAYGPLLSREFYFGIRWRPQNKKKNK